MGGWGGVSNLFSFLWITYREINLITSFYCKIFPITSVSQHNSHLALSLLISLVLWGILLPQILKTFWSLSPNVKVERFLTRRDLHLQNIQTHMRCLAWFDTICYSYEGELILEPANLLKLTLIDGCQDRSVGRWIPALLFWQISALRKAI